MDASLRLAELFESLSNFERTRQGAAAWSLDTPRALLAGAGARPEAGLWIQVAGSKGKGTTVAYLEALARAVGLSTGTYTSPHLDCIAERVRLDGRPVPPEVLLAAVEATLAVARDLDLAPSFFEVMTAAAVRVFRDAVPDLVVLEVGLGGRLDATTAVPVQACLLTAIELEHQDLLGATLAEIATEKAGIMRFGVPVWARADPATEALFRSHAAAVGARWHPPVRVKVLRDDGRALAGELAGPAGAEAFELSGASRFELEALGLAHACLRGLLPELELPLRPVPRPELPGRFEVRAAEDGWPLVLDGAHTPASTALVVAELQRRFPGRAVALLFASARGKQWQEALSQLSRVADSVFVTSLADTEAVPTETIVAFLRERGRSAREVEDPATGLVELCRESAVRLVTGSFYLVGAVRRILATRQ